jgi:hypothetical protein
MTGNECKTHTLINLQEDVMKPIIRKAIALTLCSASSAFAASGAENDGTGIFFWLFIGFAAMIIAFQFLPGIMMFLGMAKGLVSKEAKEPAVSTDTTKS